MRACGISLVLVNLTASDHVGVVGGHFGCSLGLGERAQECIGDAFEVDLAESGAGE